MKIAFVTNFYNHHQKPLADALYSIIGNDYYFIETAPITEERVKMGWGNEEKPSYVMQSYVDEVSEQKCREIIDTADVVIIGSAPYDMVKTRLKKGYLTFMYTERLFKVRVPYIKLPLYFLRALNRYVRFKNFYVLCASAYTAIDFARMLAFVGKTYKWAYFTEVKKYDEIDKLIEDKTTASILWVARFIDCKNPEIAIEIARRLKADGYDFKLSMIGNGELEDSIKALVANNDLSDRVEMLGAMKPTEVRVHMEKSEIFLFTSDRNEGWGAVLNESMNSACAVVANKAIGSVPFLIKEGENGYTYKDGDIDGLYMRVKLLLDDAEDRKRIAQNAYSTMVNEWNAENAADRFISLCEKILGGEHKPFPYECGVCSKAKILKDGWYRK